MGDYVLLIKLACRDLINSKRFYFWTLSFIAIGLLSLVFVLNFKSSFQSYMSTRSQMILGADLSLSSRFPINTQIINKAQKFLKPQATTHVIGFLTMAQSKHQSKLVRVELKTSDFPYYGSRLLSNSTKLKNMQLAENEVVVDHQALMQFKIEPGNFIKIGGTQFQIVDFVQSDSSQTLNFDFGVSTIYMGKKAIEKTGLISRGSTVQYSTYFKLKTELDRQRKKELVDIINDSAVRVSTPEDSSERISRALNYVFDFLGLVSLTSFILSLLGLFFILRTHLGLRQRTFALMKSLGLHKRELYFIEIIKILILTLIACLIAFLLIYSLKPVINWGITYLLGANFNFYIFRHNFILIYLSTISLTVLIYIPLLIKHISPRVDALLQNTYESVLKVSLFSFFLILIYLIALSVYLTKSYYLGPAFILAIFVCLLIILPIFYLYLKLLNNTRCSLPIEYLYALRNITRFEFMSYCLFYAFFTGTLLLAIIPLIQNSLMDEISLNDREESPTHFLIDIQEDQKNDLIQTISNNQSKLIKISPMIRARLTHINGHKLSSKDVLFETRESKRADRFRNRGVNLSYINRNESIEGIVAGEPFEDQINSDLAQISLEKRYANRIGANLGDILTFNILEVPIRAKVQSIRRVHWTEFTPNFFILFSPGFLEDAPKTYIAAIKSMEDSIQISQRIVDKFSNVTVLNLENIVSKISDLLQQMSYALLFMGFVLFIVGLFVIYGLITYQMYFRKKDILLFKTLGLSQRSMIKSLYFEYVCIFFPAGLLSFASAIIITSLINWYFFDGLSFPSLKVAILILLIVFLLVLLLIYFTTSQFMRLSPKKYLN